MTGAIQLIYFLHMFAVGVMAPVLALALMAHGATIETVSLLLGTYSATVIAAEFPSGVLADLFGQKRMYLLSALFAALCYGLLILSQTIAVLVFALVCSGLSRAFASGTLDALAVNQTPARDEAALLKITSRFSILESAGLALGAVAGGLLAGIGEAYAGNLAAALCLYALLFFLALCLIRETRARGVRKTASVRSLFGGQVKRSLSFVLQKGVIRAVLFLAAATGFALAAVETYWQPAYASFDPASWTLGLVSFGGFCSVMIGSKLLSHFLKRRANRVPLSYLLLRALLGAGLIGLFFASGEAPFVSAYMASYLFLGGGGVAENTLIHRHAPDDRRSSVISLFSFILQLGCVAAAVTGYFVSANGDFRLLWPIAGALLILCAGLQINACKGKRHNGERSMP